MSFRYESVTSDTSESALREYASDSPARCDSAMCSAIATLRACVSRSARSLELRLVQLDLHGSPETQPYFSQNFLEPGVQPAMTSSLTPKQRTRALRASTFSLFDVGTTVSCVCPALDIDIARPPRGRRPATSWGCLFCGALRPGQGA